MSVLKMGGLAKGIVVNTQDPSGFKRIRVRIPQIHGTIEEEFYSSSGGNALARVSRVPDNAIPWAEVNYPYGSDITPEVNQVVLVGFLNGDADKPIVLGWLGYEYGNKEEPLKVEKG